MCNAEITKSNNAAVLNPIRWKSQYYDVDSGLYWIENRWYDPERGRYINAASPETLLQNASTVFAINLYTLCTANPIAVLFAASTFLPSLDFYYDGEYKTFWEQFGNWILFGIGVIALVAACVAAPFTCGTSAGAAAAIGTTLAKIALDTAVGTVLALTICGTVAGAMGTLNNRLFWQGFEDHVSENWVETLVTSFAFSAVSVAATNVILELNI